MVMKNPFDFVYESDPVETINTMLQQTWNELCRYYDISTCMPELNCLFSGIDFQDPEIAAERLVASMLMEIMEDISRFSAWYRMPARSFGIISVREPSSNLIHWMLAPEANQRWRVILDKVTRMIRQYSGLIKAVVIMDTLLDEDSIDPSVRLVCACEPPHTIHLRKSIINRIEIFCDDCLKPYHFIGLLAF